MDGKRLEKVNKLLLKEIGDIFQKELKPKVPSLMITVTRVNVTSDLSYARVYLSVFGVDEKKKVVEEVGQNAKAIRGLLGNRIRHQMYLIGGVCDPLKGFIISPRPEEADSTVHRPDQFFICLKYLPDIHLPNTSVQPA